MQQISMPQKPQTPQSPIPRARYEFLQNEIARWQEDNILNRAQGEEILGRYSVEANKQHGLVLLLSVGVCVLGISFLLYISSNDHAIDAKTKAIAIVASMISCYFSAFKLKDKTPMKTLLAECLTFLGCVLFGGGMVLVAQQFQITGDYHDILLWAISIAPVAVLFRSKASAILCSALMLYQIVHPGTNGLSFSWFSILGSLSALYCAYYTRSQMSLFLALCATGTSLSVVNRNFDEFILVFFGITCFIMHLWHEHSNRWKFFSTPYLLGSMTLLAVGLLSLFSEYSPETFFQKCTLQHTQIAAVGTLAVLSCLLKSPARKTIWPSICGLSVIGLVMLLAYGNVVDNKVMVMCLVFAANLFYLFYISSNIENRFIQFIPVAPLTIYALTLISAAPGGALMGSGITFGVGLVLMICSFAALASSMSTRTLRAETQVEHTRG